MRRDVFQAIADPVRRQILENLASQSLSTNEILENFEISKQAITKHLKILAECGLVTTYKKGKERYYAIEPKSLIPAFMWIDQLQKEWVDKIDSFEKYINQLNKETDAKRG